MRRVYERPAKSATGLMTSTASSSRIRTRTLLNRLLREVGVPEDKLHDDARISTDLNLESVAFVELQVALEDELDVELDPVKVVELDQLSAIAQYLDSLLSAR